MTFRSCRQPDIFTKKVFSVRILVLSVFLTGINTLYATESLQTVSTDTISKSVVQTTATVTDTATLTAEAANQTTPIAKDTATLTAEATNQTTPTAKDTAKKSAETQAAQTTTTDTLAKVKPIQFGIGFSMGFYSPEGVNSYLKSYWDEQLADKYMVTETGFPEMYVNYGLNLYLTFAFSQTFRLQVPFEFGWGPKLIVIDDTKFFQYLRLSPGAILGIYTRMESGNEFEFGGGLMYHTLMFEDFKAHTLGYRAKLAFHIRTPNTTPCIYLLFDYASTKTDDTFYNYTNGEDEKMVLDHIGLTLGLSIGF